MSSALPHRFRVSENPCNPQCLGMYKFPEQGNSLWKAISFSGCKFLRKIELIRKPQQSQEHESVKISYYGYIIGKITLLPYYALRKKCPYSELFWSAFFPNFPAFGLNTERYRVYTEGSDNPHNSKIWETSSHWFPNVWEYIFSHGEKDRITHIFLIHRSGEIFPVGLGN